jgi:hypothetical protein
MVYLIFKKAQMQPEMGRAKPSFAGFIESAKKAASAALALIGTSLCCEYR